MPGIQKIKSALKNTILSLRGSTKRQESDDVGAAGLARLPVEILLHIGFEVGFLSGSKDILISQ